MGFLTIFAVINNIVHMKYIIFIFILGTLLSSCGKDEDDLTLKEQLEREQLKVNQDSINALLAGKWYAEPRRMKLNFEFSEDRSRFVLCRDPKDGYKMDYFNTGEYFFIKNDKYPNVYMLCTFTDKVYEGKFCATFFAFRDYKVLCNWVWIMEDINTPFDEIMDIFRYWDKNDIYYNASSIALMNKITE